MEKLVRKIILYVAIRLDGYIVRGDVALHGQGVIQIIKIAIKNF